MITHSESIKELLAAMLKVQGAVGGVVRDATNPHFKSRYATLENVVDAIRPPCVAAGLVVMQSPNTESGVVTVQTMIAHAASGEWMSSVLPVPVTKADAQGIGSAITYASRYSLMALFNLPPVDDDGEVAVGRNSEVKPKSAYRARKDGDWEAIIKEMAECTTPDTLRDWGIANRERIGALPDKWQDHVREAYEDRMTDLRASEQSMLAAAE